MFWIFLCIDLIKGLSYSYNVGIINQIYRYVYASKRHKISCFSVETLKIFWRNHFEWMQKYLRSNACIDLWKRKGEIQWTKKIVGCVTEEEKRIKRKKTELKWIYLGSRSYITWKLGIGEESCYGMSIGNMLWRTFDVIYYP